MESRVLGTDPGVLHFQPCADSVFFPADLDRNNGVPLTAGRTKFQAWFSSWNWGDVSPISSGIHCEKASSRTFRRFAPAWLHIAESHLLCCRRSLKHSQTAGCLTIADPTQAALSGLRLSAISHLLSEVIPSGTDTIPTG